MNLTDYTGTNLESLHRSTEYLCRKARERDLRHCRWLVVANIVAAGILIVTLILGR